MSAKFYEITDRLDNFKKLEDIDSSVISELVKYLEEEKYARYFFRELENPTWVLPLHENGFFSKVPPPLEDPNNPGYFGMPVWDAGEYLKQMGSSFPYVVKEVALSLVTDNSRAIRTMLEAVLNIPVNITAETVSEFRRWMETPFANFMMLAHELGIIMEYLAKGGQVEAALEVLDILLDPVKIKDRFEETKLIASSRHDFYWLNQSLQNNLPVLNETDPIGVVSISEKQLVKAIELEYDPKINDKSKKRNSYWRLSISPRSDVNYDRDLKNLLVNTIILALNKACEQKQDQAPKIIARYIDSEYSIFRRISVYVLCTWGKQFPELLEKAYLRHVKEPIIAGQSEFDRLLEIQFNNLPVFAKKDLLKGINEGPDSEWVNSLLKEIPDKIEGEAEEEKKQTLIETWQLRELDRISVHLDGAEKELYERLLKKHGKPSPRLEEGVVVTSWEGPESPIEIEGLSKKSINEVIQYLLEYAPSSEESFGAPSREGLGRALETDVQARVNDYAQNAKLFINENLPFVYHAHYFRGLENAIKKQEKFPLTNVIALCEYIVSQEKDIFLKQEFEEGLSSAKLAVVQLFEELFRVKEPYIENELLEKSGQIIAKLLHQEEPFPDNEQDQGYDPATHSLNCVHGVAMHSLVSYGLYCERKRKKEIGDDGSTPVMIPLVKEILTEKLDKTKNPSLAVHSVLGWYFPQFIYLDKEWALENREKIFPIKTEMAKYWRAAWSAYIRFSDVYTNVFPELVGQYQRALEELPIPEKKQGLDRSDEKMATHILKAYLLDMIKLDSEDGLLPLYYQKADDETRSHGNFWLSQVLDAQKPSSQDATWQKIWNLWQWRLQEATASNEKSNYSKEISSFSRLMKNVPLELSELYPIIEQTLEFKTDGFEIEEILKYLGKNCEKHPRFAILILHKVILSNQQLYLLEDAKKGTEKTLISAMGADDDSKAKAIEIINVFGERGDYSWRPLLDKSRE
jgi:hypothetical protein